MVSSLSLGTHVWDWKRSLWVLMEVIFFSFLSYQLHILILSSFPRFLTRFPFRNQELIKLNAVTHNILALKKYINSQHLFCYMEIRNRAILPLEHEFPRPFIFLELANVPLSCWKFLFIPPWLRRIMQIQMWMQRWYNFYGLTFATEWNLAWKSAKHAFLRRTCH